MKKKCKIETQKKKQQQLVLHNWKNEASLLFLLKK